MRNVTAPDVRLFDLGGVLVVLDALRPRYRLAALSNSNAVHWERNTIDLGVTSVFDAVYSSHQLGRHQPEPAIYREALSRLGVRPERGRSGND